MKVCVSAILMAALTVAMLGMDLGYSQVNRMVPHLFLGGVITVLFVGLCQFGYEIINWSFLLLIPLTALLLWASTFMSVGPSQMSPAYGAPYGQEKPVCGSNVQVSQVPQVPQVTQPPNPPPQSCVQPLYDLNYCCE